MDNKPFLVAADAALVNAAVEQAALAAGRAAAVIEGAGPAIASAMLRRHAVLAAGGDAQAAAALVTANPEHPGTPIERYHKALQASFPADGGSDELIRAIEVAGLGSSIDSRTREAVAGLLARPPVGESVIVGAATLTGVIVAPAAASREAARAASLAAAHYLARRGLTSGPWLAPFELDAAARSAAVQVERSNAWAEWVRAWCRLLTREAGSAERAVRSTQARLADERAMVRRQARVGSTDDAVLAHLHATAAFTIRGAATALKVTTPTVGTSIERLAAMGLATELTGLRRDRIWTSNAMLSLAARS
jgi:hypothetical protein